MTRTEEIIYHAILSAREIKTDAEILVIAERAADEIKDIPIHKPAELADKLAGGTG